MTAQQIYWATQATKQEKMGKTLRAKHLRTGEVRWLNQAIGNEKTARGIRAHWNV